MDNAEFYEQLKEKLKEIISRNHIENEQLDVVFVKPISAEQAIGNPSRNDFPILKGREVMIEASFKGSKGQAFTDSPLNFKGTTSDLLKLTLCNNSEKAIFIASLNAIMRHFGYISGTIHCKNEEPELCADRLVAYMKDKFGKAKIAFIGFQPSMISKLSKSFEMKVIDLDLDNIGKEKFGVKILGPEETEEVVSWADIIIATGSTASNGTMERFLREKKVIFYGVTGAGACSILGVERFCPFSKD